MSIPRISLEVACQQAQRAHKAPHRIERVFQEVVDGLSIAGQEEPEALKIHQALLKHCTQDNSARAKPSDQLSLALRVVACLGSGISAWSLEVASREVLPAGNAPGADLARAMIFDLHPNPDQPSGQTYLDPLMKLERIGQSLKSQAPLQQVAPQILDLLNFPADQGPRTAQVRTLPVLVPQLRASAQGNPDWLPALPKVQESPLAQYSKLLGAAQAASQPDQVLDSQHAQPLASRLDPQIFLKSATQIATHLAGQAPATATSDLSLRAQQILSHWEDDSNTGLENQRRRQLYQGLGSLIEQPELKSLYEQGINEPARPWVLSLLAASNLPQEQRLQQASQSMLEVDDYLASEGMKVFKTWAQEQGTPWQQALCEEQSTWKHRRILKELAQGSQADLANMQAQVASLIDSTQVSLLDPSLRSPKQFEGVDDLRRRLPKVLRAEDIAAERQGNEQSRSSQHRELVEALLPKDFEPGQSYQVTALAGLLTLSALLQHREVPAEKLLQTCSAELLRESQKEASLLGSHLKLQDGVASALNPLATHPWQKEVLKASLSLPEKLEFLAHPPRWTSAYAKQGHLQSQLQRPWGSPDQAQAELTKVQAFAQGVEALMQPFPYWESVADVADDGIVNQALTKDGLQPTYLALHDLVEHGLLGRSTNPSADLVPTFCYQVKDYSLKADDLKNFAEKFAQVDPGDWQNQVRQELGPPASSNLKAQLFLEHLSQEEWQQAEQKPEEIVERVKRAVVGENIATAEREILMAPWLLQGLEALEQGQLSLPPIPETIQDQLAELHSQQVDNPTVFQDYTSEQAVDLKERLVAAKGPVYARAEQILETMDQSAHSLALHQRQSGFQPDTFAHLKAVLSPDSSGQRLV